MPAMTQNALLLDKTLFRRLEKPRTQPFFLKVRVLQPILP